MSSAAGVVCQVCKRKFRSYHGLRVHEGRVCGVVSGGGGSDFDSVSSGSASASEGELSDGEDVFYTQEDDGAGFVRAPKDQFWGSTTDKVAELPGTPKTVSCVFLG